MTRFSICIPAYNRAKYLPPLLDSIVTQDFNDYDIIVSEDCSPEREEIKRIISEYQRQYGDKKIHYFESERNLGYDGNLRQLIRLARGRYCFFMGNDDLLCPGALRRVDDELNKFRNVGIVLRSYGWFNEEGVEQVVHYCPSDKLFKAGEEAIVFAYRRVGVIAGFVVNREKAKKFDTDQYDGTLFYQMYLTFNVLRDMDALYINEQIVLCRNNVPPDFGHAVAEKGIYTPGQYTAKSRLRMVSNIIDIAKQECRKHHLPFFHKISADIAKYSFPILSRERQRGIVSFVKSYFYLGHLGLARKIHFHAYFVLLLLLGKNNSDRLVFTIKNRIGHTPSL